MRTREEAIACCLQLADVYEDYPFRDKNWTVMRHYQNKKAFAWIFERPGKYLGECKMCRGLVTILAAKIRGRHSRLSSQ